MNKYGGCTTDSPQLNQLTVKQDDLSEYLLLLPPSLRPSSEARRFVRILTVCYLHLYVPPHTMATLVTATATPVHAYAQSGPNFERGCQFLQSQRWPTGLTGAVMQNMAHTCFRIFIVDDSGSMGASDGARIVTTSRGLHGKKVNCTRWAELAEAVKFHAEFAYQAQAPSEFRLLNAGNPVQIGNVEDGGASRNYIMQLMNGSPGGVTPLCKHILQVANLIRTMETDLRAQNQMVSLTIFTDGEASDGNVAHALKQLYNLPVRIIIRLCTDQESIVNYWNDVDANLELHLDILDDLFGENDEVRKHNKWLNYAEPLHRCREWGSHFKEFDLLDEAKLNMDQVRTVCALILGGDKNAYPHPAADKAGFLNYVKRQQGTQPTVMNPKTKMLSPWIDTGKLGGGGCTIC